MVEVYTSTYSHIDVYESVINDIPLMRRCDDNWVNATQILKIAGFGKAQRTRLLEREVHKFNHRKVQGGHGKFQGTWVPLEFAKDLAIRHKISIDDLSVLFYDPEKHSPLKNKKSSLLSSSNSNNSKNNSNKNKNDNTNNNNNKFKNSANKVIKDNKSIDKKRQLSLDSKNSSKKLSSPQKIRKDNIDLINTTDINSLPPTFGMFNNPQKNLHSKSKSTSSIKTNHLTPINANTPPPSADQIYNYQQQQQLYQFNNSHQFQQQIQPHQLEAQRELQYLQKQQHEIGHPQYNNNPNTTTNNNNNLQKHSLNRSIQSANNIPQYKGHHSNHSIQSISSDSQHIRESSDTSTSSTGYMIYDKSLNQRVPQFNNSNNSIIQPPNQNQTHFQQQTNQPSYQLPQHQSLQIQQQNYKQNHNGYSPQLINSQNTTFDNSLDIQDYYTSQLLSFFINDSPVPDFLYNPPSDFDINRPIDDEGHTPLHWASALAAVDIIKLLVANNADTLILNDAGMNALSKLVHFSNSYDWKNFTVILPLLKHCLVVPDSNLRTPIHYLMELSSVPNKQNSSRYYFHEILNFVKSQQKEAEKFNNCNNDNNNNNRQLLQVLINHSDINGDTALHLAIKSDSRDLIKELIIYGADISRVGIQSIPQDILKEIQMEQKYKQQNMVNQLNNQMNIPINNMNIKMSNLNDVSYPQYQTRNSSVNTIDGNVYQNNNSVNQMNYLTSNDTTNIVPANNEINHNVVPNNISPNNNNSVDADHDNPFLMTKNESNSVYKSKGTPQTIIVQRTPICELDMSEDKENIFDNIIKQELETTKEIPGTTISTPAKMDIDHSLSTVNNNTNIDNENDDDDDMVTNTTTENKIERIDEEALLIVKPSKIDINEMNNFSKTIPQLFSQLKNSLENKNDHLNHNVETIHRLNNEILNTTVKNSKFLKQLSKVTKLETNNVDFMKVASSDKLIKDYSSTNLRIMNDRLNTKRDNLYNLCERSQALKVAKLVNIEENTIAEETQIPKQNNKLSNSDRLKLAIELTLLQITRRKIMEKSVEFYLEEGLDDEDFCFDENAIDTNMLPSDADNFRMMSSKISVYKKLISSICGLPAGDINSDLLNGIEKVLS